MDQQWQQPPEPPPGAEDLPLAGLLAELLASSGPGDGAAAESSATPPSGAEALDWLVEAPPASEAPDLLRALDEAEQCRHEIESPEISSLLLARLLEESAAESPEAEAPAPEASAADGASSSAKEPPSLAGALAPAAGEFEAPEPLPVPPLAAAHEEESQLEEATPEAALSGLSSAASGGLPAVEETASEEPLAPAQPLAGEAEAQPALQADPLAGNLPAAQPEEAAPEAAPEEVAVHAEPPHAEAASACQSPSWSDPDLEPSAPEPALLPKEDLFAAAAAEAGPVADSMPELVPEAECPAAAPFAEEPLEGAALAQETAPPEPAAEVRQPSLLPKPSILQPPTAEPPAAAAAPELPLAAASSARASVSEPPEEDDFELVDAEQAERMLDRLIDAARSVIRSSLPAMQASSAASPAPAVEGAAAPSGAEPPPAPTREEPPPAPRRLAEDSRAEVSPVPPAAALMALGLPERLRARLESIGDLDRILKSRSTLTAVPEQGPRLLVFRVGGESYGLHMEHVREVERVGRVTAVPGAPDFVKGLVNLRGEILPLLDLGALLGQPASPEPQGRLVVAQAAPEEPPVALLVEELNGLAPLSEGNVAPGADAGWSRGVIEHRGRQVTWLDPAAVFGAEALERAAQSAARPEASR